MPIDNAKLGNVTALLMDQLDAYGDDASISHVIVLAAVDRADGDTVHFAVSDGMANYVGIGLLRQVLARIEVA